MNMHAIFGKDLGGSEIASYIVQEIDFIDVGIAVFAIVDRPLPVVKYPGLRRGDARLSPPSPPLPQHPPPQRRARDHVDQNPQRDQQAEIRGPEAAEELHHVPQGVVGDDRHEAVHPQREAGDDKAEGERQLYERAGQRREGRQNWRGKSGRAGKVASRDVHIRSCDV